MPTRYPRAAMASRSRNSGMAAGATHGALRTDGAGLDGAELLLDTGPLVAALNQRDKFHAWPRVALREGPSRKLGEIRFRGGRR